MPSAPLCVPEGCSVTSGRVALVLNFLGMACPICNKILLFAFGATTQLTDFAPIQLYVALARLILGGVTVAIELRRRIGRSAREGRPVRS